MIRPAPGFAFADGEAVRGCNAQSAGGGPRLEASRTAGSGAAGLGSVFEGPFTTSTGCRWIHASIFDVKIIFTLMTCPYEF